MYIYIIEIKEVCSCPFLKTFVKVTEPFFILSDYIIRLAADFCVYHDLFITQNINHAMLFNSKTEANKYISSIKTKDFFVFEIEKVEVIEELEDLYKVNYNK